MQNLLAVAELKALAHRAYITEIKQTGEVIRITLYEKARLEAEGIPALLGQYGNDLNFKLENSPYFLLKFRPSKARKNSVLDRARGFAEALCRYVQE